ncbi:pilus (MSHA type) biogenesis protein MshL [Hydrogenimonas thermophila]|uniref:pilus (MSHA type) biogenesis protein MshL n=1 Tax=Hydrogenimonas thermophila TaxID=223786 RepID=UPI00293720E8|nr:pilus (MSHA type) biogenesis protein MshL [Hydrogenimonas thermophila]WOE68938.1 pilus (MSHA type) biogenesis protein MshL [Hydrogenimonas thermophila]WOE71445.1 pilus (MSHA type) biogenesis protein MshL [Hydrogenimonas thermophila]
MRLQNLTLSLLSTILCISVYTTDIYAACEENIFNIKAKAGVRIFEIINQLAQECDLTLIIKDSDAKQKLNTPIERLSLKDATLQEVLNVVLNEYNLNYSIEGNVLKISYLLTKTFHVDYIGTERQSNSNTKVSLTSGSSSTQSMSSGDSESGMEITSDDIFIFWSEFSEQIKNILNRPGDEYQAGEPVIDRESGLITITGTKKQLDRVENYIKQLMDRLHKQVMIDVKMYAVVLNEGKQTGIDWRQIYSIQNIKLSAGASRTNSAIISAPATSGISGIIGRTAIFTDFVMNAEIGTIIKFLKSQGDVHSVSNPKILTLNNQAAMITVGKQYFYKVTNSTTTSNTGGSTVSQNEIIDSVFAGVLLDITPEISSDETITLKINPSVSDTINAIVESVSRTMPPDLERRQMSTVVTVKNGDHVILGGLITEKENIQNNKVPILGDIPLLGYAFKYEEKTKETVELVIIVTPYLIKKEAPVNMEKLGYNQVNGKKFKQSKTIIIESSNRDSKLNKKQVYIK